MAYYTLPYQDLAELVDQRIVLPKDKNYLRPASVYLPIGKKVYQLSSSFIPYPTPLIQSLDRNGTIEYEFDINDVFTIHPNTHYLFELDVELDLNFSHWGAFHTRSTAGRNDLLVSIIGNQQPLFNEVNRGYRGKLWALVYSHSFSIRVSPGDCLSQMRIQTEWWESSPVRKYLPNTPMRHLIRINAMPDANGVVGWQSHGNDVPFSWKSALIDKLRYFTPIMPHIGSGGEYQIVLPAGAFTILRSLRQFSIPIDQALTIDTYAGGIGEFRSHYAGFVDPGFGLDEASSIVFEARSPYRLTLNHGQVFAVAQVEYLLKPTEYPYKGTYNGQDLRLAAQFS